MTDTQLYLAIGVPVVVNAAMLSLIVLLLRAYLDARLNALEVKFDERFNSLVEQMRIGFAAVNQRFDDMRDLWRAELGRVEEVLDARLKHLEGK
jgi:hypothetical protein